MDTVFEPLVFRETPTSTLTNYQKPADPPPPPPARRLAHVVRLATLAYWAPALTINALMLWRGRLSTDSAVAVSSALFREAVLFLALWFALGFVQAVLYGRSRESGRGRTRVKFAARTGVMTPGRERRSH